MTRSEVTLPSAVLDAGRKESVPDARRRCIVSPSAPRWGLGVPCGVRLGVVMTVAFRRRLSCPHCDCTAAGRCDTRSVDSTWRRLDLGVWRLVVRAASAASAVPSTGF